MVLGVAATEEAAAFDFAGKRVEMVVPFAEGGGADTWARFIARFLAEKLPGKPTLVVRNVPGGGAINGANYFAQHAKPDGHTFLAISASIYNAYVLSPNDRRIKFDPTKWTGILASPLGNVVFARTSTGFKSAADLSKPAAEPLIVPLQSATGGDIRALLTLDLLDIAIKPVFGVEGSEASLGFQRGEYNINKDTAAAYIQQTIPLIERGEAVPLFTFGYLDESGKVGRDPRFPELPSFIEVYKDLHKKEPTGPAFDAWMTFFSGGVMTSKALVLPGGTPQEIVDVYNRAIQAMVDDPAFQTAAKEELGGYRQLTGAEAQKSIAAAWQMSPATRDWITKWLKTKFNAQL